MDRSLTLFVFRRRALNWRGAVVVAAALALLSAGVGAPVAFGQRQGCQLTVTMRDPAAVLELQVYPGPRWSSLVAEGNTRPVANAFLPLSGRAVFPLPCGSYVVVPVLTETGVLAGHQAMPRPVALDGADTVALPLDAVGPDLSVFDPS